jgi:Coenzyme PQQ synthesis protein D (PqqD)
VGRPLNSIKLWEFHIEDGIVLVRPDVQGLFLLNSTARLIWSEFRRGCSRDEIVLSLVAAFNIHPEIAGRDVDTTITSWHRDLLVEPVSPIPFSPAVDHEPEVCPLHCLVNGRAVRVLLETGEIWDEIYPRIDPLRKDNLTPVCTFAVRQAAERVLVLRDGVCIGNEENVAAARTILLRAMASASEPLAILHAGGSGGVLLAGHSQSGKSTLCAALMTRGLPYHCDDTAVIDREFRIVPMPFPLMLREGSWPLLDSRLPELRAAPVYSRWGSKVRFIMPLNTAEPGLARALVFVKRDPATQTQLTELSVLDSLLALRGSGFWVEHKQESIERFLGWLAGISRYHLCYAELEEAERIVEELAGDAALSTPIAAL